MLARSCVVVVLLLVIASAATADAQTRSLEDARAADREGDIERARRGYEAALDEGRATVTELVEIHTRLGVLSSAMGEADGARAHFRVALALSPDLTAPRDLAPAQLEALEVLRRERGGRALAAAITAPASHVRSSDLSLAIEARASSGAGVSRMRVRLEPGGTERTVEGVGPATMVVAAAEIGDAPSVVVRLALLDVHGATLAESRATIVLRDHPSRRTIAVEPLRRFPSTSGDPLVPSPTRPHTQRTVDADRSPSLLASPWLWLTVGVVVAGGVTAGVIVATSGGGVDVGAPVIR